MFRHFVIAVLLICAAFIWSDLAFAAQSTADVTVTEKMKRAGRESLLGSRGEAMISAEPYVIGHGDVLSVSVYGEGDMAAALVNAAARPGEEASGLRTADRGVMVMLDGRISLKHIGDVEVVGLTLTELADYLKTLYQTVFSDPIVTTTLVQSNSLRYTVMGNVTGPGIFYLDYPITLVQVIARSGGFTEWANKELTLVRERAGGQDNGLFKGNTMEFDYDRFISGKDIGRNIAIRSGDIIIVH
ncbi:polysaccharide biosynthesis/export family protein [Thermodesulfobacteriota bacterium]